MAIHIIIAYGSTLGFSRAYQALNLETLYGSSMAQSRLVRLKRHGARVDWLQLSQMNASQCSYYSKLGKPGHE